MKTDPVSPESTFSRDAESSERSADSADASALRSEDSASRLTKAGVAEGLAASALRSEDSASRLNEFPGFANVFADQGEADIISPTPNRREFLALSSAALGLAAVAGCRRPDLQILPYTQTPEFVVPGLPLYYATSMPKPGGCVPILVESHEGRPTKIEGHPAFGGGCDAHTQASILDLYSPDRSKQVLHKGKPSSWEAFDAFAAEHFAELKKKEGEGLRFLIEDHPSPALRLLREHMKEKFPKAVWHVYEPIDNANSREGTSIAFGEPARFEVYRQRRIVSLDCDFLGLEGNQVADGREFAQTRRGQSIRQLFGSEDHNTEMSRLYVLESTYTITGTMADHRLRVPAAHVVDYAVALAKEIVARVKLKSVPPAIRDALEAAPPPGIAVPEKWINEVAADLLEGEVEKEVGKYLVLVGYRQPPLVHALAGFINDLFVAVAAVKSPSVAEVNQSIHALVKAIDVSEVRTLVVVGGNPAWNAPADLQFPAALGTVPTIIRLGMFVDETSERATWHLPQAHYLESWGDAETAAGIYSCQQPLIAPLHNGRSALEFLVQVSSYDNAISHADAKAKIYALLQKSFAKRSGKKDAFAFKRFIQEGHVTNSSDGLASVIGVGDVAIGKAIAAHRPTKPISPTNLEITFHPSYALYDGRFAWNAWLLELPDPITKLVWDNAALVSPKTAEHLQVKTGDVLEIDNGHAKVKIPAFILPGQADWSIALTLGWGKLRPSRVEGGGGFDVYPLRRSDAMHFTTAKVTKTGEHYDLVVTQEHGTISKDKEDDIIRDYSLMEYTKKWERPGEPGASATGGSARIVEGDHPPVADAPGSPGAHDDPKSRFQWGYKQAAYREAGPEMAGVKRIALETAQDVSFPQRLDGDMQWGMVIDLNSCTGCSACVIACQAENNIPIVGKHEVKMNREMHWISLHRYFSSDDGKTPAENPRIVSQPMMCQHCEAAPCESVCPVNAAVHSPEGLNLQVYNRCIGTRYCSNNCPYKARRFNWFDFNKRRLDELRVPTPFSEAGVPETLKMQKNPEVTVRMRGVMEKCTYCIQRIERAKIGAKVLAIKAGDDKADTPPTNDPKKEYQQGYAIRVIDGLSRIIVPDGIIHTACEQACPTGAIVFGNVRDEQSRVFKLKNQGTDYLVEGGLNTKPRTSYLPRVRNLNPKMPRAGGGA